MSPIKIPVLDLKPQYEQIKDEVQGAINRFFLPQQNP
jgi:hypothetical protein